jgi:hypothetical protein
MQNTVEIRLKCVELALMERDVIDKEAKRTYRGVRVPAIGGVPEPGDELLARAGEILAWATQVAEEAPQNEKESGERLEPGNETSLIQILFMPDGLIHDWHLDIKRLYDNGIAVTAYKYIPGNGGYVLYRPQSTDVIPKDWEHLRGDAFAKAFDMFEKSKPKEVVPSGDPQNNCSVDKQREWLLKVGYVETSPGRYALGYNGLNYDMLAVLLYLKPVNGTKHVDALNVSLKEKGLNVLLLDSCATNTMAVIVVEDNFTLQIIEKLPDWTVMLESTYPGLFANRFNNFIVGKKVSDQISI